MYVYVYIYIYIYIYNRLITQSANFCLESNSLGGDPPPSAVRDALRSELVF